MRGGCRLWNPARQEDHISFPALFTASREVRYVDGVLTSWTAALGALHPSIKITDYKLCICHARLVLRAWLPDPIQGIYNANHANPTHNARIHEAKPQHRVPIPSTPIDPTTSPSPSDSPPSDSTETTPSQSHSSPPSSSQTPNTPPAPPSSSYTSSPDSSTTSDTCLRRHLSARRTSRPTSAA